MIVLPNTDPQVIAASAAAGIASLPGCWTATEAFAALQAGAHALKFFPAEAMSPAVVKALAAVLPPTVPKLVVGGITPETMQPWVVAGAAGFGLGSALYKKGDAAATVAATRTPLLRRWTHSHCKHCADVSPSVGVGAWPVRGGSADACGKQRTITNPILPSGPDPWIVRAGDTYST